jgi:uncharacterized protein YjbI with pentapeptide repeats
LRTGLSKEAIRKAINNKISRFRNPTAHKFADFIEKETNGQVVAQSLLNVEQKDFHGVDLRGTRSLAGEDLSGADFAYADLRDVDLSGCNLKMVKLARAKLQNATLSNVSGWGADLMGANLAGATLANSSIYGWNCSGVVMRGAQIINMFVDHTCRFHAADLSNLKSFEGTEWDVIATSSRGLKMDGSDITKLKASRGQCIEATSKLFFNLFPDDFEIQQLLEFGRSRIHEIIPGEQTCYTGFSIRLLKLYPHRIDDIRQRLALYPNWFVWDRIDFGIQTAGLRTLEDWENFKTNSHFYKLDRSFRGIFSRQIRKLKRIA